MKILLSFFLLSLIAGCARSPTLEGAWKAVRDYDYFHAEWRPSREDISLVFSGDGAFRIVKSGVIDSTGTFTIDQSANPHQILLTDADGKTARGIYVIDGNRLTLRIADKPGSTEYPNSLDPNDGDAKLALVEFHRK